MYELHELVTGVPAKSATHGGLGWSTVCLLEGHGRRVLVDTGPPVYIERLHRELEVFGLGADDITDLLVTHLHWDHVGNLTMFPNARVHLSPRELDWAAAQQPGTVFVPDLQVALLDARRDRIVPVEDGGEPLPDLTVIDATGHTPGHLAYRAVTTAGVVIFAGDAVKNRNELATGRSDSALDHQASAATIGRLRHLLSEDPAAVLVPGHDVRLAIRDEAVTVLGRHEIDLSVFLDPEPTGAPRRLL